MSEKAEQNAPERCSCCTCGYTWVKGQHGGHSCAQVMEVTVADLRARRAKYEDAEGWPVVAGHLAVINKAYMALTGYLPGHRNAITDEAIEACRSALNSSHVDAPTYRAYTTTPGEAVAGIALRQLGDESRWVEIRDLNAHAFPDIGPHDYYPVGTELRLPTLSAPSHGEQVREGWQLVPVEPNEAIRDAINLLCDDHSAFDDSDAFWSYLLATAPSAGSQEQA